MSMDITGVEKWAESMRRLQGVQKIRLGQRLVSTDEKGKRYLDALSQPDFFEEILQDFVNKELVGAKGLLNTEFHRRAKGKEHHPRFRPKTGGRTESDIVGRRARLRAMNRYEQSSAAYMQGEDGGEGGIVEGIHTPQMSSKKWVDLSDGFSDLWQAIRKTTITKDSGGVSAGIGPGADIMGLQLSDYSKLSGNSNIDRTFNSLWLATEYGTGIAENTGGHVRTDGPTKDKDGSGRWWVYAYRAGQEREDGALFEGQKGFHFLHEARSRQPLEVYEKLVRDLLPQYVSRALGQRSGSVGVRSR
jgi:hypothetical protein